MELITVYKYCPHCGVKGPQTGDSSCRKVVCDKCGMVIYIAPAACVAVYIIKQPNEVLLVKRKVDPLVGKWDVPGGFIEYNESAEDACIREIKEELAIDINNIIYIETVTDSYLYKDINYYTLGLVYTAQTNAKKLHAQDDISAAKFFKFTEIPWENIGFNSVVNSLRRLINAKSS